MCAYGLQLLAQALRFRHPTTSRATSVQRQLITRELGALTKSAIYGRARLLALESTI
ncbi:hypothetical protein FIBSPDRAFT_874500 [Athelia psychrophila]|uniref:Uncharacterized protein n=1 Tax=Athelia psychrophila TaxID=1759441 RepID=A0A165XEE6_9AGAM|nr:hypothetical protein FIBSPDRAFT_874500 [Fibularhizoctonia sp. CBS 109695]